MRRGRGAVAMKSMQLPATKGREGGNRRGGGRKTQEKNAKAVKNDWHAYPKLSEARWAIGMEVSDQGSKVDRLYLAKQQAEISCSGRPPSRVHSSQPDRPATCRRSQGHQKGANERARPWWRALRDACGDLRVTAFAMQVASHGVFECETRRWNNTCAAIGICCATVSAMHGALRGGTTPADVCQSASWEAPIDAVHRAMPVSGGV